MLFWLTLPFLFSQIFAGIAIISDFISFQCKDRKKIITFFIISAVLVFLHYLLLERYVAAIVIWIWIIRFFVSYYSTKKYRIYIFISLFAFTTIVFFKDIYDIFIFLWISLITIWVFQKNDKLLRIFMMFWTSMIILYNLLILSPVWVLLEWLFLWSNFIWYYRHYIKKKKKD